MKAKPPEYPVAGFFRRLMALVYDLFLLLGISFAYGTAITLLKKLFGIDPLIPPGTLMGIATLAGLWFCCALFYGWCWVRSGQTLGMKSWRIMVTQADGGSLSWKKSWGRCIAASLCNGCFGAGMIFCLINPKNNALQDILTGSRVVVFPKG